MNTLQYHALLSSYAYAERLGDEIPELMLIASGLSEDNIHWHITHHPVYGYTLAFRGTQPASIHNWMCDCDVAQIRNPHGSGSVHRGFAHALAGQYPTIRKAISFLQYPLATLTITGHSLGGALATLCGAWLKHDKAMIDKVFTFGSPRVGSPAFALKYPCPHVRVVNGNDPVPHVPWLSFWPPAIYKHVGPEYPVGTHTLNPLDSHFLLAYIRALAIDAERPV